MIFMKDLFLQWHIDIVMLIFIIALIFLYLFIVKLRLNKQSVYFFSGLFFFIIATISPLHFLGMNYLFSAHMASHVMLLLLAAPLLLLSIPAENRFTKPLLIFSKKIRASVFLCWLTGVSIMWFWHVPFIYNRLFTMNMPMMHHSMNLLSYVHHFSLLFAGMLFAWPLLNPYPNYRIHPLAGIAYLSTACIFCSLLGLLITFAPQGLYTNHLSLNSNDFFSTMIKSKWSITAATDQQAAGLIMWVPCCFIYITGCMFLLKRWYDEKEETATLSTI